MKTINLYHITSVNHTEHEDYYSLEPWNQPTTHGGMIDARAVHREDDGGKDYILPDDGATWEVAETKSGEVLLWRDDEHVEIGRHEPSGLPQVYGYSPCEMSALKLAAE